MTMSNLIQDAEALVARKMAHYDPSHDTLHVFRVRTMALRLASSIPGTNPQVVELAALFHDLLDHKYETDKHAAETDIRELLERHAVPAQTADEVVQVVKNVGYSLEKKLKAAGQWTQWHDTCNELHCVTDADRLDAIGAMGIYRVAAFSSAKNRALFEIGNSDTAHQHFYDKLLHVKDSLKTPLGRQVGAKRHEIMVQFVNAAETEFECGDF